MKFFLVSCFFSLIGWAIIISGQEVTSGFKWNYCSSDHVINIDQLYVSPIITLGENVTVSFQGSISRNITSGKVDLKLEKKEGIWVEIPCISNIGSCTYDNFCSLIHPPNNDCGPIVDKYNLPCECPYIAGKYALPTIQIPTQVPNNIPSWLESGDYYIKAQITDSKGIIICIEVYATIQVKGGKIYIS